MSLETPEEKPEGPKVERHPDEGRRFPRRKSTEPLPEKKSVFRELGRKLPRVEELENEEEK
jgi:hypothetical protein